MTEDELAFWTTSAQLTVVLALALMVEFRIAFVHNAQTPPSMKITQTAIIVLNALGIGLAFYWSVGALYYEFADAWQRDWTRNALVVSFGLTLLSTVIFVLIRVWGDPAARQKVRSR